MRCGIFIYRGNHQRSRKHSFHPLNKSYKSFVKKIIPGTTSVQLSLQPGSVRMLFVRRKTLIELVREFITGGRK